MKKVRKLSKKNKWKRREERRLKRLNGTGSGSADSKPDRNKKEYENAAHCSEFRRESKTKNGKELVTKARLTLKPFGKRHKFHDVMSWPSIKIPDSIAQDVEEGVKKMTREAKKIRNSNTISSSDLKPENSTCDMSTKRLTSVKGEEHYIDLINVTESSSLSGNNKKHAKSTTSQIDDNTNIAKTKYQVKIDKERPRSLSNVRAWLDTAGKLNDDASVTDVCHDEHEAVKTVNLTATKTKSVDESHHAETKSVSDNLEVLLPSIALYHHTGKFMWQGLNCIAGKKSITINTAKAKLKSLLTKHDNKDGKTADTKSESSQELYWTACEKPFDNMNEKGSQYTYSSSKLRKSAALEDMIGSVGNKRLSSSVYRNLTRPGGPETTDCVTSNWHSSNRWGLRNLGESSGGLLSYASHDIFEEDDINPFPIQESPCYNLHLHKQSPVTNPVSAKSYYGCHDNRLPFSNDYSWSSHKGWLCRTNRPATHSRPTFSSNPKTTLQDEWPFMPCSTTIGQNSNDQHQGSINVNPFMESPMMTTDAPIHRLNQIMEPTYHVHMESPHQQRCCGCCRKYHMRLDVNCKTAFPSETAVFINKPFVS